MHLTNPLLALLASASLSTALPSSSPNKPVKTQDIINALAGTYTSTLR